MPSSTRAGSATPRAIRPLCGRDDVASLGSWNQAITQPSTPQPAANSSSKISAISIASSRMPTPPDLRNTHSERPPTPAAGAPSATLHTPRPLRKTAASPAMNSSPSPAPRHPHPHPLRNPPRDHHTCQTCGSRAPRNQTRDRPHPPRLQGRLQLPQNVRTLCTRLQPRPRRLPPLHTRAHSPSPRPLLHLGPSGQSVAAFSRVPAGNPAPHRPRPSRNPLPPPPV